MSVISNHNQYIMLYLTKYYTFRFNSCGFHALVVDTSIIVTQASWFVHHRIQNFKAVDLIIWFTMVNAVQFPNLFTWICQFFVDERTFHPQRQTPTPYKGLSYPRKRNTMLQLHCLWVSQCLYPTRQWVIIEWLDQRKYIFTWWSGVQSLAQSRNSTQPTGQMKNY